MSDDERNRLELTSEDARFIERVGEAYTPTKPGASQRAEFRQALDGRIAARERPRFTLPLAGFAAATAAVALWLYLPGATDPSPVVQPQLVAEAEATSDEIEETVDSVDEALFTLTASEDRDTSLPDDYAAIASLLLDG